METSLSRCVLLTWPHRAFAQRAQGAAAAQTSDAREGKGKRRSCTGSHSCSQPAHRSSDPHSEPGQISSPASFTGKTLWGFWEVFAQQPILGGLQAEAGGLLKQCCHMYCKDDWKLLAFCVIHTQKTIFSFCIPSKWRGGRDKHDCDFNTPITDGDVCLA